MTTNLASPPATRRRDAQFALAAAVLGFILPIINSPVARGVAVVAIIAALALSIRSLRVDDRHGMATTALVISGLTVLIWAVTFAAILGASS